MLLLYQCLCLGGRMLSVCKGKGLFTVCRCRCVGLRGMHVGLAGWNGDAGENVTIRRLCILVEVAFVSSGWCALWGPVLQSPKFHRQPHDPATQAYSCHVPDTDRCRDTAVRPVHGLAAGRILNYPSEGKTRSTVPSRQISKVYQGSHELEALTSHQ